MRHGDDALLFLCGSVGMPVCISATSRHGFVSILWCVHGSGRTATLTTPVPTVLDRTHTIAAHMGQRAHQDMLVTFVIGADDGQCHKNPIVAVIVGNKRFRKVVHCNETGRSRFKPPPKRQPNSFNYWIPLGWCGNLLRSPPYFHDPCIWQFVQFAVLTCHCV